MLGRRRTRAIALQSEPVVEYACECLPVRLCKRLTLRHGRRLALRERAPKRCDCFRNLGDNLALLLGSGRKGGCRGGRSCSDRLRRGALVRGQDVR